MSEIPSQNPQKIEPPHEHEESGQELVRQAPEQKKPLLEKLRKWMDQAGWNDEDRKVTEEFLSSFEQSNYGEPGSSIFESAKNIVDALVYLSEKDQIDPMYRGSNNPLLLEIKKVVGCDQIFSGIVKNTSLRRDLLSVPPSKVPEGVSKELRDQQAFLTGRFNRLWMDIDAQRTVPRPLELGRLAEELRVYERDVTSYERACDTFTLPQLRQLFEVRLNEKLAKEGRPAAPPMSDSEFQKYVEDLEKPLPKPKAVTSEFIAGSSSLKLVDASNHTFFFEKNSLVIHGWDGNAWIATVDRTTGKIFKVETYDAQGEPHPNTNANTLKEVQDLASRLTAQPPALNGLELSTEDDTNWSQWMSLHRQLPLMEDISKSLRALREGKKLSDVDLLMGNMAQYSLERDRYALAMGAEKESDQQRTYRKHVELAAGFGIIIGIDKGSELAWKGMKLGAEQMKLGYAYIKTMLSSRGIPSENLPPPEVVLAQVEKASVGPLSKQLCNELFHVSAIDFLLYAYIMYYSEDKMKAAMEFASYFLVMRGVGAAGTSAAWFATRILLSLNVESKAALFIARLPGHPLVKLAAAIAVIWFGAECIQKFTDKVVDMIPDSYMKKDFGDALNSVGTFYLVPLSDLTEDLKMRDCGIKDVTDNAFMPYLTKKSTNLDTDSTKNRPFVNQGGREPGFTTFDEDDARSISHDHETWDRDVQKRMDDPNLPKLMQRVLSLKLINLSPVHCSALPVEKRKKLEQELINLSSREQCDYVRIHYPDLWKKNWMTNPKVRMWTAQAFTEASMLRAREIEFFRKLSDAGVELYKKEDHQPLYGSILDFVLSNDTHLSSVDTLDEQLGWKLAGNGEYGGNSLHDLNDQIESLKKEDISKEWKELRRDVGAFALEMSAYRLMNVYDHDTWFGKDFSTFHDQTKAPPLTAIARSGLEERLIYMMKRRDAMKFDPKREEATTYAGDLVRSTRPPSELPLDKNIYEYISYILDLSGMIQWISDQFTGKAEEKARLKELREELVRLAESLAMKFGDVKVNPTTARQLREALQPIYEMALANDAGTPPTLKVLDELRWHLVRENVRRDVLTNELLPYNEKHRAELPFTFEEMETWGEKCNELFILRTPVIQRVGNAAGKLEDREFQWAWFLDSYGKDFPAYQKFMQHADFYKKYFEIWRKKGVPFWDCRHQIQAAEEWDRMERPPFIDQSTFSLWQQSAQSSLETKMSTAVDPFHAKSWETTRTSPLQFPVVTLRRGETTASRQDKLVKTLLGRVASVDADAKPEKMRPFVLKLPNANDGKPPKVTNSRLSELDDAWISRIESMSSDPRNRDSQWGSSEPQDINFHYFSEKRSYVPIEYIPSEFAYGSMIRTYARSMMKSENRAKDLPFLMRIPGFDPFDPKLEAFSMRGFFSSYGKYRSPKRETDDVPFAIKQFNISPVSVSPVFGQDLNLMPPWHIQQPQISNIPFPRNSALPWIKSDFYSQQLSKDIPRGGRFGYVRDLSGFVPLHKVVGDIDASIAINAKDLPRFLQSLLKDDLLNEERLSQLEERVVVMADVTEPEENKNIISSFNGSSSPLRWSISP